LNGERLPLDGATDRFTIEQVGEVQHQCDIVAVPMFSTPSPGGAADPPWKLAVIVVVCAVVGVALVLLVVLLVLFCVRRRRTHRSKGD